MDLPPRELTRNVLRYYRAAPPEHLRAGLDWYDLAFTEIERLVFRSGSPVGMTRAVIATAALSPRASWKANLYAVQELLGARPAPPGTFGRSWMAASSALTIEDPWDTFSTRALKTYHFARAILGDRRAVVVDVWAGRVAGVAEESVRRPSVYNMVADAYRRAARIEQVAPRDLQAATWCAIRGRAN